MFKTLNRNHYILISIFLLALFLRLWHIDNPLLDEHHWRQTTSAIVARNYVESPNPLKPDVGLEYPYPMAFGLYEYLVAVIAKVTGFSDILGRIVTLLFFFAGFIYFYLLVKKFWDEKTALWALAFYAFLPVSVFYSRSFQGDSCMVSSSIIFLYFFTEWADTGKWLYFFLSVFLANLTFLFKIPSLFMFVPAAYYLYVKERYKIFYDWKWYVFAVFSASLPVLYHIYVPIATDNRVFSALFSQDKWGDSGILLGFNFWWKTFYLNLSEYQFTHTGYIFLLLGLIKKPQKENQRLFYVWAGIIAVFFVTAAKGIHHEYYSLPLMPVACVFIGRFLGGFYSTAKERWARDIRGKAVVVLVSVMLLYSFVFSIVRLSDRLKPDLRYLEIAGAVRENTSSGDAILVLSKNETEIHYYAGRRGNHIRRPEQIEEYLGSNYKVIATAGFAADQIPSDIVKKLKQKYDIISSNGFGMVAVKKK